MKIDKLDTMCFSTNVKKHQERRYMVTKIVRKRSFFEMAFNKAKFQGIVDGLIEQIIQNW